MTGCNRKDAPRSKPATMPLYRIFMAIMIACCILGYLGLGFGLVGYGFWVIGVIFLFLAIWAHRSRAKEKHLPPEKTL